jgi:hypothetical protein
MVKLIVKGREVLIDDEDYERVTHYSWRFDNHGYPKTQITQKINTDKKRIIIRLHRFILNLTNKDKILIDHINGNILDNRKSNLRSVTYQQNSMNSKIRKNNRSGYKGVTIDGKKYRSRITMNRKIINLGTYSTKEEAAKKYNEAALKYFGEYARLNVIKGEK